MNERVSGERFRVWAANNQVLKFMKPSDEFIYLDDGDLMRGCEGPMAMRR